MTDKKEKDIQEQDAVMIDVFEKALRDNYKVIQAYNKKYETPLRQTDWVGLGVVTDHRSTGNRLVIQCDAGQAELLWISEAILHVRVTQASQFAPYFSYHVVNLASDIEKISVIEDNNYLSVNFPNYGYRIDKATTQITCYRGGSVVYQHHQGHLLRDDGAVGLSMNLVKGETCYGTGERAFELDLRGRILDMWNVDPGGYQRGDDPVNYCVGFYLGVNGSGCYGLLWDNPAKGQIDLGATRSHELKLTSETGALSYYLFAGTTINETMQRYSQVTGRMPMPPLWALGYHQSRYSYMSQEEVLEMAQMLRERDIPCDAIYLDIDYMDGYRVFTWNQEAFADLAGMIQQLHDMGIKLVIIMDPGVKVDEGYVGHDSGVEEDIFITYPDGKIAAGVVWPGLCYFPDFTNPKARSWWGDQLAPLLEAGVDGIWNDMNEPLIFHFEGKPLWLPLYTCQDKEGLGGAHHELHNVYGMLMGRASREALDKHRPGKRQFNIIRAGAAGAQRDSSSWTGDNYSTWDDLHLSISTILQMGLSGVSFTGADVGGFNLDADGELLARWTQAGALLPFFRNHSAVRRARQEPWSFGEDYETVVREAIELRYRMMPYLYTQFALCAYQGFPIVQPLFSAEMDNTSLRSIDDCYLLGDRVLVAPIMHSQALRRTVYLPEGDWYNFHNNERIAGGRLVAVDAPIDCLPIFVRSGTVLPLWDAKPSLEMTQEHLTLRIYADSGETVLYEDAGEGKGYENGEYRWITFKCEETSDTMTIERVVNGTYTPPYQSIRMQFIGASQTLRLIEVDGASIEGWTFTDGISEAIIDKDFERIRVAI